MIEQLVAPVQNSERVLAGKILPIHVNGSEVLRKSCVDVDLSDKELPQFIANLYATMKGADGIGIAAPQVGVNKNIFVMDMSDFEGDEDMSNDNPDLGRMAFINPRIVEISEDVCSFKEGCLSVPGINENVERPRVIKVHFYDDSLQERQMTFSGIWARAFQHEYEHLQGKLFIDSIAQIRKQMLLPKLQSMTKGKYKARYRTVKR